MRAASGLRDIGPDIERTFQFTGHQDPRGIRMVRQPVGDLKCERRVRIDAALLYRPGTGQKRQRRNSAHGQ